MFGAGKTRLQPVYVEDVAEAITRTLQLPIAHRLYELAGPNIYRYEELLSMTSRSITEACRSCPFRSRARQTRSDMADLVHRHKRSIHEATWV